MKLVSAQRADDLLPRIKARFAEFNKTSSPSKGRKYPEELMALVRQALLDGSEPSTLCQLTGVSSTAMSRWAEAATSAQGRRQAPKAKPRRLDVVNDGPSMCAGPALVRLPSGVTIELADGGALTGELLAALAALGVSHAASR